jgi:hypothetical protein
VACRHGLFFGTLNQINQIALSLMRPFKSSLRSADIAAAVMLAVMVMCAQWIGLHHGIRHAGLPHPFTLAVQLDSGEDIPSHSCIAFDAAALADSISPAPYCAPLLTGVQVLALWSAFASWDSPFTPYFSSRAPPLP